MGGLAGEEDSDNIAAPSGPYRGRRLLNILVINRFSGAAYRCAVYCPGACRCISIRSLNLATLIYAFFFPFFFLFGANPPPHYVYSIGSSETFFSFLFFVRQGALCSRQQGSKTASEDGAVREGKGGTRRDGWREGVRVVMAGVGGGGGGSGGGSSGGSGSSGGGASDKEAKAHEHAGPGE